MKLKSLKKESSPQTRNARGLRWLRVCRDFFWKGTQTSQSRGWDGEHIKHIIIHWFLVPVAAAFLVEVGLGVFIRHPTSEAAKPQIEQQIGSIVQKL